jgi:hypothetical protein
LFCDAHFACSIGNLSLELYNALSVPVYRIAEVGMVQVRFIYGDSAKRGVLLSQQKPSNDTNQKGIIFVCIVTKKTY